MGNCECLEREDEKYQLHVQTKEDREYTNPGNFKGGNKFQLLEKDAEEDDEVKDNKLKFTMERHEEEIPEVVVEKKVEVVVTSKTKSQSFGVMNVNPVVKKTETKNYEFIDGDEFDIKYCKQIFEHLNIFRKSLSTLESKLESFDASAFNINPERVKEALRIIAEVSKEYKAKSLMWSEKPAATLCALLQDSLSNPSTEIDATMHKVNKNFSHTIIIEGKHEPEDSALVLLLSAEDLKAVFSKEVALASIGYAQEGPEDNKKKLTGACFFKK